MMGETLRERIARRSRPRTVYRLRIDDAAREGEEFAAARKRRQAAEVRGADEDTVASLRAVEEKARAAYEACFVEVALTAARAGDYEALLGQHPPRPGNPDDENAKFNTSTFPAALLAECSNAGMTAGEWAEVLDGMSYGERVELQIIVQALNIRTPSPSIPKD